MAINVLLVEGKNDQAFLSAYCDQLFGQDYVGVKFLTPAEVPLESDNPSGDGWGNLINNLPIRLNQLTSGDIDKLGIVLDADYNGANQGGFSARYALLTGKLQSAGYIIPSVAAHGSGDIFTHSNGLAGLGLWIMPDHQQDGMLEDFIATLITDRQQQSLLSHANQTIEKLPFSLFDTALHTAKAKVFTWRAWQKTPGLSLNAALKAGILDKSATPNFSEWLETLFNSLRFTRTNPL
ncbi:MAG: hypothetical protein PHW13_10550 [Methylococcales bacterium]|nr:hypothetical protein [Methylococcales bacterium]